MTMCKHCGLAILWAKDWWHITGFRYCEPPTLGTVAEPEK